MRSEGTQVMWDLAGCDEALAVLSGLGDFGGFHSEWRGDVICLCWQGSLWQLH